MSGAISWLRMFNGDGDEEVAFVDEDEGLTRKVEMADGFVRAFLTCWYRSVPYAASKNASEFDIFIQFLYNYKQKLDTLLISIIIVL